MKQSTDTNKVPFNKSVLPSWSYLIGFLASATGVGMLFNHVGIPETNIVIVYIFSVVLTARLTSGYKYGIFASIMATFLFNYFFTFPKFTLLVNDLNYIITFVIMTVTALITSAMTSRIKENVIEAHARENETKALFRFTTRLTEASDTNEVARITVDMINEVFGYQAECLSIEQEKGNSLTQLLQNLSESKGHRFAKGCKSTAEWMKSHPNEVYRSATHHYWLGSVNEHIVGLVCIRNEEIVGIQEAQRNLLISMFESMALAMDRFIQLNQRIKANEEMVHERYRANLLRAISHDLRTPLSGIMGTSEMLMDLLEENLHGYNLAHDIYEDAVWLRTLVENILNLTKLQEGKLVLNKNLEAVEEIVGAAIGHMAKRSPDFPIKIDIPSDLLFILVDASLIEQVLINLMDNAIKHSMVHEEITLCVEIESPRNRVRFSVVDSGEGIPAEDLDKVFQMFYTSGKRRTEVKHGIGLGLTICEAIVNAHGGEITVKNRTDSKGTIFSFWLPIGEDTNE